MEIKTIGVIVIALGILLFASGCIDNDNVDEQLEKIKIGAVLPLTGGAAKYGENAKMGIDLAVDEINAAGGINGKEIEVIYEDGQATPQQTLSAFRKLTSVDNVPVVIGEMASSATLAIAPIAEENKVILISPASSNPSMTSSGDYVFRTALSDNYEGEEMAKVARQKLNLTNVSILYINNDYGVGLKDVFKKDFEEMGGKIVSIEVFDQDATDVRAQLAKINGVTPEAIYLVGYKEMIQILKQKKELGIETRVLSTIMFDDPEILEKTGDAAEGTIFTTWAEDPSGGRVDLINFRQNFETKYNAEPESFAAESYDALKVVAAAIEKYGYDADAIKKGLYETQSYPGASGVISFDSNGDVVKSLSLKKVENGTFVFVKL